MRRASAGEYDEEIIVGNNINMEPKEISSEGVFLEIYHIEDENAFTYII
jgi:hypothetical protein